MVRGQPIHFGQSDGNRQQILFNEHENQLGNSNPIQWSHVMYSFSYQRLKWQRMQTLMTEEWHISRPSPPPD